MSDEELELEEEQEVEEPKKDTNKIELKFDMDALDRLKEEVNFTESVYIKAVGNFLIKEFEKDRNLKEAYFNKKRTLEDTWKYILSVARKRATSGTAVMSDEEVFGIAVHYIIDGETKAPKEEKFTMSKQEKKSLEEQAKAEYLAEQKAKLEAAEKKKAEKEKAAKERALEKEKKAREDSGQLSLFDW